MGKALRNGRAFDWNSLQVDMLGNIVIGITEIEFGDKQNKVNNYAQGPHPSSRGYGNIEPKCSITLEQKEIERIKETLPRGQSLRDIAPFTITVSWTENYRPVTYKIKGCEFTDNMRSIKQGDTNSLVKCELIVAEIEES